MATHDYVIANGTGAAVRSDLNGALAAIVSQNSSATEPSPSYAYQRWADTSAGVMKMRNGANNAWITLYQLDGEWSTIAFENGTAAAPSIYFKDSGTDTGFYSPGADQIGISTGGTGRITVDASGNVNIDSNTLYVDAANNRVGIGTSSPDALFEASVNSSSIAYPVHITNSVNYGWGVGLKFRQRITSGGSLVDSAAVTSNWISDNNSDLKFATTASGTLGTRLTITPAGNVGIGTASPGSALEINAAAATSPFIAKINTAEAARIDSSSRLLVGTSTSTSAYYDAVSDWQGRFQVARSDQNAVASFSTWNSTASTYTNYGGAQLHFSACKSGTVGSHTSGALTSGDTVGSITFSPSDGTNFRNCARIEAVVDGGVSTGDVPGRLVFSTTADGAASPTERMRINSSGAFKASSNGSYTGATSAYHEFYQTTNVIGLFIRGTNASQTSSILEINGDRTTTNASYNLIDAYNGNVSGRFSVRDSGNAVNTNNSYGAISDIKLKENIVDANSQWGDLKALQVRNYNFKEGQTHTQIGLVAQEAELVSPGLVTESPDRDAEGNDLGTVTKSVNYSVLYMKAVKALQEAMERIETLEAKVTALETA